MAQGSGLHVLFAPDGDTRFAAANDGLGGALGQIFAAFALGRARKVRRTDADNHQTAVDGSPVGGPEIARS